MLVVAMVTGATPMAAEVHPRANVWVNEEALLSRPRAVGVAWFDYLMWKISVVRAASSKKTGGNDLWSPEQEVTAREVLVKAWTATKQGDHDAYLDDLQRVFSAGFMREYVWVYLRSPSWEQEPSGLRLAEFNSWATANFRAHRAETLMDIGSEGRKL
jgi:hypothetical protein